MSRQYQNSADVPTDVLCKRLDELADCVTRGETNSFYMRRVPAEYDYDAGLVMAEASKRLSSLTRQRDALAEGLKDIASDSECNCTDAHYFSCDACLMDCARQALKDAGMEESKMKHPERVRLVKTLALDALHIGTHGIVIEGTMAEPGMVRVRFDTGHVINMYRHELELVTGYSEARID